MSSFEKNFTSVMKYFYNISFEDFKKDFIEATNLIPDYVSDNYVHSYFDMINQNFIAMWNKFDESTAVYFINKAFDKYGFAYDD